MISFLTTSLFQTVVPKPISAVSPLGPLHDTPRQSKIRSLLDEIIRVDHAGEFGAIKIYNGQLLFLKDDPSGPTIKEMADQELEHLNTFHKLMTNFRARPSLLQPIWEVMGFGIGAATALLGREGAMACTVAVEEVIGNHYNDQIRVLIDLLSKENPQSTNELNQLKDILVNFRDDELEHRNTGLDHGAESAPIYPILSSSIKAGTRLAVKIASKV